MKVRLHSYKGSRTPDIIIRNKSGDFPPGCHATGAASLQLLAAISLSHSKVKKLLEGCSAGQAVNIGLHEQALNHLSPDIPVM